MSEKDEEFRYSLKIVDYNIKHPANLEEAWANEMEEDPEGANGAISIDQKGS